MCRPKKYVLYTEACGHYTLPWSEDDSHPEACPQATKRQMGPNFVEWSPCAILICELEIQRKGRWGWEATVDGVVIEVSSSSSGHCEAWREKGFKKPNYRTLAETAKAEKLEQQKKENKVVDLESGTSGSSTPLVESRNSSSIPSTTEVDNTSVEGRRDKFKRGIFSLLS
jgi:hypothetical protein